MKNSLLIFLLTISAFFANTGLANKEMHQHESKTDHADQGDHKDHQEKENHEDHGGHEDKGATEFGSEKIKMAKIQVGPLIAKQVHYQVYAPGEIKSNAYNSIYVSPRIDSIVVKRHAALGDHVKKGQALVSLFSEQMVEAQAQFRIAHSEWKRVQSLGQKAVGQKRFVAAQNDYQAAYGRLVAYGLDNRAIKRLEKGSKKLGNYTLYAQQAGAVLVDDFHQGQRVQAGQPLFEIADERTLWVEARVSPNKVMPVRVGSLAKVKAAGRWYQAKVVQAAHTIDPVTRTRTIRLLVENKNDYLHSGMFADVYFQFESSGPVLAVEASALMRGADGDWQVFVEEEKNHFKPQEVELGAVYGKLQQIKGIAAGTRIVLKGAFFVASELAKGSFDPHDH